MTKRRESYLLSPGDPDIKVLERHHFAEQVGGSGNVVALIDLSMALLASSAPAKNAMICREEIEQGTWADSFD